MVCDIAVPRAEATDVVQGDGASTEAFRMPVTQVRVRVGVNWTRLGGHAGRRLP